MKSNALFVQNSSINVSRNACSDTAFGILTARCAFGTTDGRLGVGVGAGIGKVWSGGECILMSTSTRGGMGCLSLLQWSPSDWFQWLTRTCWRLQDHEVGRRKQLQINPKACPTSVYLSTEKDKSTGVCSHIENPWLWLLRFCVWHWNSQRNVWTNRDTVCTCRTWFFFVCFSNFMWWNPWVGASKSLNLSFNFRDSSFNLHDNTDTHQPPDRLRWRCSWM